MLTSVNVFHVIQAHAGAAMVNFVEECPKSILAPYLQPLSTKLHNVLSTKIQEVSIVT